MRNVELDPRQANESLPEDDVCWSQWAKYWNASSTTSTWFSTSETELTTTAIVPVGSSLSVITTTYVTVLTATVTPGVSFVVPSETYLDTQSLVYTETLYSTSNSTTTKTWTSETVFYSAYSSAITTPACELPSQYPPCQSEWEAYLQQCSGATSPACTQASVDSEQCRKMIYAAGGAGMLAGETAMDFTTSNASSTWWPAESSLAPGCTLGCQTCAITGRTVRVFYWPPSTASVWQNGSLTATLTNGAASPSGPVVTVIDNSTLTSPTVYISYDVLYASNSCSGLGKTYRNTIVPLSQSADLSSLVYVQYQGENNFMYSTRAFNYDDLQEPIPDRVFQQLPSCAREYQSFSISHFGGSNTTAFTCERHGAYSPIIAVPTEVQNLDPEWKDCTAWYGGLYDPPSALQGAPVAATPTQPSAPNTTPPEPIATITHDAPEHTQAGSTAKPSDRTDPKAENGSSGTSDSDETSDSNVGSDSHGEADTEGNSGPVGASGSNGESEPESTSNSSPSSGPNGPSDPGATSDLDETPATSPSLGDIIVSVINGGPRSSSRSQDRNPTASAGSNNQQTVEDSEREEPSPTHTHAATTKDEGRLTVGDPANGPTSRSDNHPAPTETNSHPTAADVHPPGGSPQDGIDGGSSAHDEALHSGASVIEPVPFKTTSQTDPYTRTTPSNVFTAGGETHTAVLRPYGAIIEGTTITQGQVATVGSRVVSVGSSQVFLDGSSIQYYNGFLGPSYAAAMTVDGERMTVTSRGDGDIAVGGTTMTLGEHTTFNGVPMSVAPNGIVVGSSMISYSGLSSTQTWKRGPSMLMTVSNSKLGLTTMGAAAIPANGDNPEGVVIGTDVDLVYAGQSAKLVDGLWMSLGTDGVLYTMPAAVATGRTSTASRVSSEISSGPQSSGSPTLSSFASTTATSGVGDLRLERRLGAILLVSVLALMCM